jgi:hydrogenase maturation protein HypF
MQRFLRMRPEVIAHDLHPEHLSTVYARERPEAVKIAVQHHHAHVASAMGEHGLAGPVIGVAFDGTGYGTDGTSWGGEFLVADYAGFERVATFRPIPLAGGDTAIRQVWRVALALLDDAFDGNPPLDSLPLFHDIAASQLRVIRQMIARRIQSPPAHGVGRYFDALGAIVLARPRAGYEGQVAMEWNFVADARETGAYPYVVNQRSTPWTIDLRALVRDAVGDSFHSRPASTISAKFHNTIADATAAVVRLIARRVGNLPVVLTGGCFQNALLTEAVLARLSSNLGVYRHRDVPPGDGGLALGQALVAGAIFSRRS